MLARRSACIACRARQHGAREAGIVNRRSSNKFSSIAHPTYSRPSSYHFVHPLRAGQLPLLNSSRVTRQSPLRISAPSQTRLQSTIQHASSTSPASFDGSAPSSDLPIYPLDSLDHALSVAQAARWEVGFLNSAGIDFGWGPSSVLLSIFENIHSWGGYEVGTSILIMALLQRFVVFPFIVVAKAQSVRWEAISPKMTVLQKQMREAAREQDHVRMVKARKEISGLRKKHNIKMWKMFLPMMQMPIGFASWRVLRNAAFISAPGMATGGFLWFHNLLIPDPYFILPALTGFFQYLAVKIGSESGNLTRQGPGMKTLLLRVLPTVSFVVTAFAPSAVQLSFVSTAMLSTLSNLLLANPSFRALCGILPQVATIPTMAEINQLQKKPPQGVYKGTINVANNNAKVQAQPPPKTSASSKLAKGLSMLNPMNFGKTFDNIRSETSKLVGGVMPSAMETKKEEESKRQQQKIESYEEKRLAERERQKREWERRRNERGRKR